MRLERMLLVLTLAAVTACGTTKETKRFSREETSQALKKLEVVSLELGEFPFAGPSAVLDGDTIKVKGLSASMRLLGIDTEETFEHFPKDRMLFESTSWEQYLKEKRGKSPRPVKMATPEGDDAYRWAQNFFADVTSVRIERDHPGEIRDFYGRYLAYIFAKKNGEWVNYNIEVVRAGHSPYYMKYGRSRRFHREFIEAEKEAREAKRGVWDETGTVKHYPDYPERLKWWAEREAIITRFEREADQSPDDHIALTRWDAMRKLEAMTGHEVYVLGAVAEVLQRENGPAVVKLARTRTSNFDIVFWDRDVLLASGIAFKKGEYVQVRGTVQKYKSARGSETLQIQVSLPGQVLAPSEQLEQMLSTDSKAGGIDKEDGD